MTADSMDLSLKTIAADGGADCFGVTELYWHDCYAVVNERLDWIVLRLASEIKRRGSGRFLFPRP